MRPTWHPPDRGIAAETGVIGGLLENWGVFADRIKKLERNALRSADGSPTSDIERARLTRSVVVRLLLAPVFLGALFFLPAGTVHYWQAWVYIFLMWIPMSLVSLYYLRRDPGLVARRLRSREKEASQRPIVIGYLIFFLAAFILPGLDRRFGWSNVPSWLCLAADTFVLSGYGLFVLVLRENRFASRVVEVQENQKVISTGPYALVRHPMYLAMTIMFTASPLALGSYPALAPGLVLPLLLAARIVNEEKVLAEGLSGYDAYLRKVRWRLIPGIW